MVPTGLSVGVEADTGRPVGNSAWKCERPGLVPAAFPRFISCRALAGQRMEDDNEGEPGVFEVTCGPSAEDFGEEII
jgi:hypothetical protein